MIMQIDNNYLYIVTIIMKPYNDHEVLDVMAEAISAPSIYAYSPVPSKDGADGNP